MAAPGSHVSLGSWDDCPARARRSACAQPASARPPPNAHAPAAYTGVDTPVTTTNTFSNEFSLSTEPE
ncbi:hypothetical protein GGX14DRAFT_579322 [Mycena pura]|uniref:Uncharacterized protein n=1 Tax=Mycena pura TaxID=153505 RepID=A0AAD6URX2_9AGAR|nr:hypothetical protein GGX14DRAFT_579322 [Mycena pura]